MHAWHLSRSRIVPISGDNVELTLYFSVYTKIYLSCQACVVYYRDDGVGCQIALPPLTLQAIGEC